MAGTTSRSLRAGYRAGSSALFFSRNTVFEGKPEEKDLGDDEYDAGDGDGDIEHPVDLLSVFRGGFPKDLPLYTRCRTKPRQAPVRGNDHQESVDTIMLFEVLLSPLSTPTYSLAFAI